MPSMPSICVEAVESGIRRATSGCCGRGSGAMCATTSCEPTCVDFRGQEAGEGGRQSASVLVVKKTMFSAPITSDMDALATGR